MWCQILVCKIHTQHVVNHTKSIDLTTFAPNHDNYRNFGVNFLQMPKIIKKFKTTVASWIFASDILDTLFHLKAQMVVAWKTWHRNFTPFVTPIYSANSRWQHINQRHVNYSQLLISYSMVVHTLYCRQTCCHVLISVNSWGYVYLNAPRRQIVVGHVHNAFEGGLKNFDKSTECTDPFKRTHIHTHTQ